MVYSPCQSLLPHMEKLQQPSELGPSYSLCTSVTWIPASQVVSKLMEGEGCFWALLYLWHLAYSLTTTVSFYKKNPIIMPTYQDVWMCEWMNELESITDLSFIPFLPLLTSPLLSSSFSLFFVNHFANIQLYERGGTQKDSPVVEEHIDLGVSRTILNTFFWSFTCSSL